MKLMTLFFAGLLSLLVYSGLITVYYAHEEANLISKVQHLKESKDQINAQWTQLLLEEKSLANAVLINHEIAAGMDLHLPKASQVVFLD